MRYRIEKSRALCLDHAYTIIDSETGQAVYTVTGQAKATRRARILNKRDREAKDRALSLAHRQKARGIEP